MIPMSQRVLQVISMIIRVSKAFINLDILKYSLTILNRTFPISIQPRSHFLLGHIIDFVLKTLWKMLLIDIFHDLFGALSISKLLLGEVVDSVA